MEEKYNGVYEDIAAALGRESAKVIFEMMHGQQVLFPQRLYSVEYVKWFAKHNYPEMSVRQLAVKFNYSDRHIRKLLNSSEEDGGFVN